VCDGIIYLAGPYSNDAPANPDLKATADKRVARFNAITDCARQLIELGNIVYSPLTMTHPIDVRMEHDPGSEFWVKFDEAFMAHCNHIYVLKLPGWDASSGVAREIHYFHQRSIEPVFCDPSDFDISRLNPDFVEAFN
jgi:hypothetical protein